MALDVGVDAREIRLVEHGELELDGLGVGGRARRDVEVEGALEDGGVGYGVDGGEGEEDEGFLETPDYPLGEEEQETWQAVSTRALRTYVAVQTVFAAAECFDVVCLLPFSGRLLQLAHEFCVLGLKNFGIGSLEHLKHGS